MKFSDFVSAGAIRANLHADDKQSAIHEMVDALCEAGKITREEVEGIVDRAQTLGLVVDGLMTVAPPESDSARRAFRTLKTLADGLGLPECSMGMTDDLEIAVEEGSTMIRVGRALFGGRDAAK